MEGAFLARSSVTPPAVHQHPSQSHDLFVLIFQSPLYSFPLLLDVDDVRVQGLGVIMRAQQAINRKEAPVNEIFEGVFLAVAGLFLLIPGFVTDAIGFLLFLPPLRRALASYMAKHSKFAARANYQGGGRASTRDRGNVIDGEYEVIDDDAPQLNADTDPKDIGGGSKNPESPWADKK